MRSFDRTAPRIQIVRGLPPHAAKRRGLRHIVVRYLGESRSGRGRLILATAVIGIGLSGFFDGILLHQILQWHHLLSLVPGESLRDIRTQILADGLFHILMYAITATGLWLLWRTRASLLEPQTGWRTVTGGLLLGFGLWNLIDVGVFHWILGIHRIRVDVPDPLIYDVTWLLLLGALPLGIARWLLSGSSGSSGGRLAAIGAAIIALLSASLAALPQPGSSAALVLFSPGTSLAEAMTAARAAGAVIMWVDPDGGMMLVDHRPDVERQLYRGGALLVTRSPALAGCATGSRTVA